jgi:hypothetical protein
MDFLAENRTASKPLKRYHLQTHVPGYVVKDLLVVFSRNKKNDANNGTNVDELTTLCVSDLRRKLDASREAMIESIKSNS